MMEEIKRTIAREIGIAEKDFPELLKQAEKDVRIFDDMNKRKSKKEVRRIIG